MSVARLRPGFLTQPDRPHPRACSRWRDDARQRWPRLRPPQPPQDTRLHRTPRRHRTWHVHRPDDSRARRTLRGRQPAQVGSSPRLDDQRPTTRSSAYDETASSNREPRRRHVGDQRDRAGMRRRLQRPSRRSPRPRAATSIIERRDARRGNHGRPTRGYAPSGGSLVAAGGSARRRHGSSST